MPDTLSRTALTFIDTSRLMTEDEKRQVEAALKLAGLSRRDFCRREKIGYSVLCKTLGGIRTPTGPSKQALEKLFRETHWPEDKNPR